MRQETEEALAWLRGGPPLAELKTRYPNEWETVSTELATIFASGKPEQLQTYLAGLAARVVIPAKLAGRQPARRELETAALGKAIRHRMAHLALKNYVLSAAAGGANLVEVHALGKGVRRLVATKKWTGRCETLKREITAFVRETLDRAARPGFHLLIAS